MRISIAFLASLISLSTFEAAACGSDLNSKCEERGTALVNSGLPMNPMTSREDIKKTIEILKYKKECDCYLTRSGLASKYITDPLNSRDFKAEAIALKKALAESKAAAQAPSVATATSAPEADPQKAPIDHGLSEEEKAKSACPNFASCSLSYGTHGNLLNELRSRGEIEDEESARIVQEKIDWEKGKCACYYKWFSILGNGEAPPASFETAFAGSLAVYRAKVAKRNEAILATRKKIVRGEFERCTDGRFLADNKFTKQEAYQLEELCKPGTGFMRITPEIDINNPCESFGDSLECKNERGEGSLSFYSETARGPIEFEAKQNFTPEETAKIKTLIDRLNQKRVVQKTVDKKAAASAKAKRESADCKAALDELEYCYQVTGEAIQKGYLDREENESRKTGLINVIRVSQLKKDIAAYRNLAGKAFSRFKAATKADPGDCRVTSTSLPMQKIVHPERKKQLEEKVIRSCGEYASKFRLL